MDKKRKKRVEGKRNILSLSLVSKDKEKAKWRWLILTDDKKVVRSYILRVCEKKQGRSPALFMKTSAIKIWILFKRYPFCATIAVIIIY